MEALTIDPKVEKKVREYCKANGIEDVLGFTNRCTLQGLNILKYGTSPSDNIKREENGIVDVEETTTQKEDAPKVVTTRRIRVTKRDSRKDD